MTSTWAAAAGASSIAGGLSVLQRTDEAARTGINSRDDGKVASLGPHRGHLEARMSMMQLPRKRDLLGRSRAKQTMIAAAIAAHPSRRSLDAGAMRDVETALDEALAETFPASDPIACTPKSVAELRVLGRAPQYAQSHSRVTRPSSTSRR